MARWFGSNPPDKCTVAVSAAPL
jgi:predicted ABC-type ATPase